jgi:hypothetical protein
MQKKIDESRVQNLARHSKITGQINYTAVDILEITGAETMVQVMGLIRKMIDDGKMSMRALYTDERGDLYEIDAVTYAKALASNFFKHPLSGDRIDDCAELSPFWTYIAEDAGTPELTG